MGKHAAAWIIQLGTAERSLSFFLRSCADGSATWTGSRQRAVTFPSRTAAQRYGRSVLGGDFSAVAA